MTRAYRAMSPSLRWCRRSLITSSSISSKPPSRPERPAAFICRCACLDRPMRKILSMRTGDFVRSRALGTPSMKQPYLLASLLLASTAASAQQSISTLPPPVLVDAKVAALRDDALANDHYAWDVVEGLTTEVGQRLAATEAEARARDWAVRRLTAMGFANVHVEPFAMPVWTRGAEGAEIVSPFPQKLTIAALGYSGSTGPAGVTAEIAYFDSLDALRAAPDSAVKGKIVFIDHHMMPAQDGSGYGQFGAPRRQGPTIASLKGAIGIVVRSIGTDHHRNPHTGVQYFTDGATPIPAGALTVPDSEEPGGFGGRAFAQAHTTDRYAIAGESDFGADRVWRFSTQLSKLDPAAYGQLTAALAPLGITRNDNGDADGTDIGPTVTAGAPWISLNQDGTRYFDWHHTPDDTLDKIDPAQLRQNVAAWATVLAILSGGIESGPKRPQRR